MPRSRCCWFSAEIAWLVLALGSHWQSWLAQQLQSAAVSAFTISEMSHPDSPEHAVLTRSRSLHSSVHSVASQVKPACAPFGCRQVWYSSQTLAQSTPLPGGIIVTPGTYNGHPMPAGRVGQACGRTWHSGGNRALARVGGHHPICDRWTWRVSMSPSRRSVGGRPRQPVAERACLIVLANLVGTVEHWARALDDAGLRSFEARRGHASGVRLLRAIRQAESVFRNAIEAEGRIDARPGHQVSSVHVGADRS